MDGGKGRRGASRFNGEFNKGGGVSPGREGYTRGGGGVGGGVFGGGGLCFCGVWGGGGGGVLWVGGGGLVDFGGV